MHLIESIFMFFVSNLGICFNFSGHPVSDDEDVSDLMPPLQRQEIKNGQWMGVTVRSQGIGGKVRLEWI